MDKKMVKAGFFQFTPEFGNVDANLKTVVSALRNTEADIIVLPELAFSGYLFSDRQELESLADDPHQSETVTRLTMLCRKGGSYIVTGFAEKNGDKIYNSALTIGADGLLHVYRKLHLFNTEKTYFDPGDTPLEAIDIGGVKIGVMVCFDWVFPEVARVLALKGADILCHPANLVLNYCQQAMRTRAIENSVFAISANRCGIENRPAGNLTFTGQSQVVAPDGELIYRAPPISQEVFVAEIDIARARDKAMTQRNDLFADRRPDYYKALTSQL